MANAMCAMCAVRALTCNPWLDLPLHAASIARELGEGDRQQGRDKLQAAEAGRAGERGRGGNGRLGRIDVSGSGWVVVVWSVEPANRSVLLRAHENGGRRRRNERAIDATRWCRRSKERRAGGAAQREEGKGGDPGGEIVRSRAWGDCASSNDDLGNKKTRYTMASSAELFINSFPPYRTTLHRSTRLDQQRGDALF